MPSGQSTTAPPPPEAEEKKVQIYVNNPDANKAAKFPSNYIKTSKYNIVTFLPLNLFDQFTRVQNFYFLINAIYAVIPGVSPVNPASAILPLVFVITVALIKEGYEDYLRHKEDTKANAVKAHVLRPNKKYRSGGGERAAAAAAGGGGEEEEEEKDDATKKSSLPYTLETVRSEDLQVGDIVRVSNGEELRADVVMLSTSETEGAGFIDTCNLDGETNLKNKKAMPATWRYKDEASIGKAKLKIVTEEPNPALLNWVGLMVIREESAESGGVETEKEVPLGLEQFLYRSSVLRNTEHVWGVVAYAGVDTKMMQNLAEKPRKYSNLDYKFRYIIVAVLIVQHIILFLICMGSVLWTKENKDDHWYAEHYIALRTGFPLWGYRYLTYFILFSFMVPISLFVTIEICKVMQVKLMEWDQEMCEWMHGKWVNAKANTSNLNEQLSQVRFIFSDKTGTLTENVMRFHDGDILGVQVDSSNYDNISKILANKSDANFHNCFRYFKALAICHTIQPFPWPEDATEEELNSGLPKYDGASPDEVALVRAAADNGFILMERSVRTLTVMILGTKHVFEILSTLEFTPDRKMMSLIVREPPELGGNIMMFTKGADSFVHPRTAQDEAHPNFAIWPGTRDRLAQLAVVGLRTLVVCEKQLTESEYSTWVHKFEEAGKALKNRSAIVDDVCLEMEDEMTIVGLTAIEDKLQDQVPETIKFFLSAGVVVWMLTGDKRETAVTIGATSSLVDPQRDIVVHIDVDCGEDAKQGLPPAEIVHKQLQVALRHLEDEEAKDKARENIDDNAPGARGTAAAAAAGIRRRNVTIVIDGVALKVVMDHHFDLFLNISQRVTSAICCRLTPLQKAKIVKMFQEATGSTALAIGDGANDVSMIQEGKVGIGIVGLEGAQATLAADYAIPRFKHLKRLCCVHGRYALYRNSLCVHFSFYKNICLAMTQIIYAFYCGFSGQTMYDGWLLSFFNFAFSSLPPLTVGMFEKDIQEEPLMMDPKIFVPLRDGAYFNPKTISLWFGEAIVHAFLIFFFTHQSRIQADLYEKDMEVLQFGTIVISALIMMVLVKLMLHIKHWTLIHVVSFAISIAGYFLFLILYNVIPNLFGYTHFYHSAFEVFNEGKFWLYLILFTVGAIGIGDMSICHFQKTVFPTLRDVAQDRYIATSRLKETIDEVFESIAEKKRKPY